jgi:hypothetical protein
VPLIQLEWDAVSIAAARGTDTLIRETDRAKIETARLRKQTVL